MISNIIKNRRKELHLTLEELGSKLGVGSSTISKWERGKITNLTLDNVKKLSEVLDIHPAILCGYSEHEVTEHIAKQSVETILIPLVDTLLPVTNITIDKNIRTYLPYRSCNKKLIGVVASKELSGQRILEGDLLVIEVTQDITEADIVIVDNNNTLLIGRLYRTGKQVTLIHLAGSYPIQLDNYKVIGKILEVRAKIGVETIW